MLGLEQTLKRPKAIVRVHRPELTDEERAKRMNKIKKATEAVLREVIRNEYNARNTNSN